MSACQAEHIGRDIVLVLVRSLLLLVRAALCKALI